MLEPGSRCLKVFSLSPDPAWSRSVCVWDNSESESSHSSRTRRQLPQVPAERLEIVVGGRAGQERLPGLESQERPCPGPPDPSQRLGLQDELDPDSLSDASRSDDGAFLEKAQKAPGPAGSGSTSFYIGSEDGPARLYKLRLLGPSDRTCDPPSRTPPTTVLIRTLSSHEAQRRGVKQNSSAPNLQTQDKDLVSSKDRASSGSGAGSGSGCGFGCGSGSGSGGQVQKLPHTSSQPSMRELEQPLLQDAPLAPPTSLRGSRKGAPPSRAEDSLSGESDVDTASTVSQVSSKNTPTGPAPKARASIRGLQKEKSSSSPSIQEKGRQLSARERLSEKRRQQVSAEVARRAEPARAVQVRRSQGACGSLDLAAAAWSESASSDQDASCPAARSRKLLAPPPRDEGGKPPLTRSNSLSAPRPTRASMLRRARLGDTSDNEGAETDRDRGSQAPEPAGAQGRKLSRLDILALPRKRTGSFTTPSDTEASSGGRSNPANRSAEPPPPNRKWSGGEARQAAAKAKQLPNRNHKRSGGARSSAAGECC